MKSFPILLAGALLAGPICIAQNSPGAFDGTVEYRAASFSSTASQGIYVYRSDGFIDRIFFRHFYSSTPWAYELPAYGQETYSYQQMDPTHGSLTLGKSPYVIPWIIEYSAPDFGTYSETHGAGDSRFVTARTREEMINTSVRTFIAAGKSSIAGFVISGTRSRWVLIRAVGPGLMTYGVATPLADPGIDLYRADGSKLNSVGSWRTAPVPPAALTGVMDYMGAFPLAPDSDDAVLFVELPPGVYSAVGHSVSGTREGEVLTEVYVLP